MSKKQMNTRIQYKYDSAEEWAKCTTKSLAGELYVHSHDDGSMSLSIGDGMRQIKYLPALGGESKEELIYPLAWSNPMYTGEPIDILDYIYAYNSDIMYYTGTSIATDIGEYELFIHLKEGYAWELPDFTTTTEPQKIIWNITKRPIHAKPSTYNIKLDAVSPEQTITIDVDCLPVVSTKVEVIYNNTDLSNYIKTSYNWNVVYNCVYLTFKLIDFSIQDDIDSTITIRIYHNTTYEEEYKDLNLKVNSVKTLDEYTWEEIDSIASNGIAPNCFDIGDVKNIILNGQIGDLVTLSNHSMYVYIIDFNHQNTENTIDFGTFKSYIQNDENFIDVSLYDGTTHFSEPDGTKNFTMYHTYNGLGGWKLCDVRYDILGSTDMNGQDASTNTTVNPPSNTLMKALPSELRSVMKPMTIYTDNVGNLDKFLSSNVTPTIDYLPLLSEFEIFGTTTYSNAQEGAHQTQYEYFKLPNLKMKYKHTDYNSSVGWWCRSPAVVGYNYFVVVAQGTPSYSQADKSLGISPIFRI